MQILNKHRSPSTLILICGSLATGIGFVALLGWFTGLPMLSSLGASRIPMAPSTALLFLLYGLGVIILSRPSSGRAASRTCMVIAAVCVFSSLLLFILSCMGIHPDAEHLGFRIAGTLDGAPIGHMSPVTAFCFLMAGLSFLASFSASTGRTRPASVAFWSSFLVVLSGLVLLLAYLFGSPLLYGSRVIPPALPTSLAFLLLGTALLAYSGQRIWPLSGMSDKAGTRSAYVLFMIFILLVSGIGIAGYLYLQNYEKEYRVGVEQQLSSIAELKVSDLVQYRRERLGDASLLYKNDHFSDMVQRFFLNPDSAQERRQVHDWLKKLQTHYQFDYVRLLDAGGITRLSEPAGLPPVSAHCLQRIADVMRTQEIAFQDFHLNEHHQKPYLSILVPILATDGDKRSIGTVILRIDPETYLYPFINHWPSPSRTAETLIIRREGSDVLFLNELRFRKNAALRLRIPLERKEVIAVQAALGRNGIVEGVDYSGVPVLASVRAVPDSPWVLIARMGVDEIYAPLRQQLWTIIALIGALLIGAGTGTALLWRQQHVRFYRERYVATEELRKSERLLSESQRLGHIGSFLYDKTGLLSWSEELYRLYGVLPETFTPTMESFLRLIHTDDQSAMQDWLAACASGSKPDALDFRIIKPDGTISFVRGWGDAALDAENRLIYLTGTVQDITEQKHAEEVLREKEEFNREVLNSLDFSVAVLDRDGHIIAINKEWERFAQQNGGATDKTGVGINYLDTCRVDAPDALNGLQAILNGALEHFELEYPCDSPRGKRWFVMKTSPLTKQRGGLIVAHINITARKRMEEELENYSMELEARVQQRTKELEEKTIQAEAANRAKSDFLANMSHELRTPLNSIIGFSEILEDGMAGPIADNQKELLNDISTSGKRLLSLINDILDLSTVEAGKMQLELSEFNLEEIIDGSLVMFKEKAMKHTITIAAEVEAGIGAIVADERKLKQVLFNLLSNAFKFSPDGGSVSVAARQMVSDVGLGIGRESKPQSPNRDRSYLQISVTDTGIGISPEDQNKLFQPFQQIDSALSRKYAGTGLGLNLCKRFVELHEGRIWVESVEGKGSKFTFAIPSQAEPSLGELVATVTKPTLEKI